MITISLRGETGNAVVAHVNACYNSRMTKNRYDKHSLEEAVGKSKSLAGVLRYLGVKPAGGNYKTLKDYLALFDIDTSHFTGQAWSRGGKFMPKYPLSYYLVEDKRVQGSLLLKRLVSEGIKDWRCERCDLEQWSGKPIPLELHHVDGNSRNNLLHNLESLCPNCHANTYNWRGRALSGTANGLKNRGGKKPRAGSTPAAPTNTCGDCGVDIYRKAKRCKSCHYKHSQKITWPNYAELIAMVNGSNYTSTGRNLGVSDNAVRKRLENHPSPSRQVG